MSSIQVTVMTIDFNSFEEPVTRVFEKDEVTLGRMPGNDLVLDRPEVSAYHARLSLRKNGGGEPRLYVTDLGSASGTQLERETLAPDVEIPIGANQRLIIGSFLVKPLVVAETRTASVDTDRSSDTEPTQKMQTAVLRDKKAEGVYSDISKEEATPTEKQKGMRWVDRFRADKGGKRDEASESAQMADLSKKGPSKKHWWESDSAEAKDNDSASTLQQELSVGLSASEEDALDVVYDSRFDMDSEELVTSTEEQSLEAGNIVSVEDNKSVYGSLDNEDMSESRNVLRHSVSIDETPVYVESNGSHGKFSMSGDDSDRLASSVVDDIDADRESALVAHVLEETLTTIAPDGDITDLYIEAEQLFNVAGRVLCKGEPLAGVLVDGGVLGRTETGADGRFAFEDVVEGTNYRLAVVKTGYVLEPSVLAGVVDTDATLNVNAVKLFTLSGRVLHKGLPLAGVRIDGGALGVTVTGADGGFVFSDVRDGTEYQLQASKDRFSFHSPNLSGTVDKDTQVSFSSRQLLTISGKVMHKGQPLVGVEVECVNLGRVKTDTSGVYVFENVPEGAEYKFTANKPGFRFSVTRTV